MRGVKLQPGQIVVLSIDGTLVYVEDIKPTYALVVALPEQPPDRREGPVFQPGRVAGKKISPYAWPDKVLKRTDLSELNRDFVDTFLELREKHGLQHIVWSDAEKAKMSVRKAGPSSRGLDPAERQARKEARRALKKKCAQCGIAKGKHPADHEFVPKTGRAPRGQGKRAQRAAAKNAKYRVASDDLSKAISHSDKFKPGNRFHRVFLALKDLAPDTTSAGATFEDVCSRIERDGGRPMADVAKVARRALKQLTSSECGNVVERC